MEQVEIDMAINGDAKKARCFRRHGRLWTAAEFKELLDDITAGVVIDRRSRQRSIWGFSFLTMAASCARIFSSMPTR